MYLSTSVVIIKLLGPAWAGSKKVRKATLAPLSVEKCYTPMIRRAITFAVYKELQFHFVLISLTWYTAEIDENRSASSFSGD